MKIYKLTWTVLGLHGKKVKYFQNESDLDLLYYTLKNAASVLEIPEGQIFLEKEEIVVD